MIIIFDVRKYQTKSNKIEHAYVQKENPCSSAIQQPVKYVAKQPQKYNRTTECQKFIRQASKFLRRAKSIPESRVGEICVAFFSL
jgi:hypothetical protein